MPRLPGLQEVGKINHHANAKNYTTANNQTIANERRNQWIMNTGCVDIRPKSTEWGNHPLYDYAITIYSTLTKFGITLGVFHKRAG